MLCLVDLADTISPQETTPCLTQKATEKSRSMSKTCLPGLTEDIVLTGADPRARLSEVSQKPRRAGQTKQDEYISFDFQIDSRNDLNTFYTIHICVYTEIIKSCADIKASCSCPFKGDGFCKHVVTCLFLLLDKEKKREPSEDSIRCKRRKLAPSTPKKKKSLHCARCFTNFLAEDKAYGCIRPHPTACIDKEGRCSRCHQSISAAQFCFSGPHESRLAFVLSEGWPDDDSSDEESK